MISDYGATEYDANSALAELDKALRSNTVGEKAEIIVKVPDYFEKYPFPIFVNAIFLKLTEVFRSSSTNYLRKLVLQVTERSERHLDKIISCDEISKRVLTVSYSNDPDARALTLRLLGCLATVLSNRKQIHHLIRTSLDSKDAEESAAAIFAAEKFAKHSKEFANAISEKVAEVLTNAEISVQTKISVLNIIQHVYNDASTTEKMFALYKNELLPANQEKAFTCAILRTFTQLSLSSLITSSAQIEILFDILSKDSRFTVKWTCLHCLRSMAQTAPHFWNKEYFKILCLHLNDLNLHTTNDISLAVEITKVMATVVGSKIIVSWGQLDDVNSDLISLCTKLFATDNDIAMASMSHVISNIIANTDSNQYDPSCVDSFVTLLVNVLPVWNWDMDESYDKLHTKVLLRSLLSICHRYQRYAINVGLAICSVSNTIPISKEPILFETFCALSDCDSRLPVKLLSSLSPKFARTLFHLRILSPTDKVDLIEWNDLSSRDQDEDGWQLYKLGRFAARYGKHDLASQIFDQVQYMVTSDYYCHWLKFLTTMSQAESLLSKSDGGENLRKVIARYTNALFYLKAAVTSAHPLRFALDYVTLRIEFLKLVDEIRVIWNVGRVAPPPSATVFSENRSEKTAHLVKQVASCANNANQLAEKYEKIVSKCFDADSNTLRALLLEKSKILLVEQCLKFITESDCISKINIPESDDFNSCCKNTLEILQGVSRDLENLRIEEQDVMRIEVIESSLSLIDRLARQPVYFPRYLFQSLQNTTFKLVLSPRPIGNEHSITIPSDQRLVLKVEGVVQCVASKKIRRVFEVVLTVSVDFGCDVVMDKKAMPAIDQTLKKTLKPHNDYFSAEFLLQFPQSGSITVRADVIDDSEGLLWHLGCEEQLRVKTTAAAQSANSHFGALPTQSAAYDVRH